MKLFDFAFCFDYDKKYCPFQPCARKNGVLEPILTMLF